MAKRAFILLASKLMIVAVKNHRIKVGNLMSGNEEMAKLFVVVDPNDDQHVALERALISYKHLDVNKGQIELYVFIAVDHEAVNTRATNDNLVRGQDWVTEEVIKPLDAADINYRIGLSWSSEWQETIAQEAKRFGAQFIYLPLHRQTNKSRFTFSESKWDLMKQADCPVILIRPGATEGRKVVLAAVNYQAVKPHQQELNTKIFAMAQVTASNYGADLHIVNGYLDSLHYPDRGMLVNKSGLDNSKIHIQQGYTSEVVAAVAKDIGADLVVMGTLGQTGRTKTRRGNTAERVIASLDVDTLVVN